MASIRSEICLPLKRGQTRENKVGPARTLRRRALLLDGADERR